MPYNMTDQQINNVYINCNRNGVEIDDLLRLCLDPQSGVKIDGLRAAGYKDIDELERRFKIEGEEIAWASATNSIDALSEYIGNCMNGTFTNRHLEEAIQRRRDLAATKEIVDWESVRVSDNLKDVEAFIDKIKRGIYSDNLMPEALEKAEELHWFSVRTSGDRDDLLNYIRKCQSGFYRVSHIREAQQKLEQMESAVILAEWTNVMSETDSMIRLQKLNEFIQRHAGNISETAKRYVDKANKEIGRIEADEKARLDWLPIKDGNDILSFVEFIRKHPTCKYREEAESKIESLKGDLLSDIARYPFRYGRKKMYEYISTGVLTYDDLVTRTHILSDKGFDHIKRYPTLASEQRELPVSTLENPTSEAGNTDIIFFGTPGSGKTCVLAGLMALEGQLGFSFDPRGAGGGGFYAMDLKNYARRSMLPPKTYQDYIQVIDGEIRDEKNILRKLSFIEMAGEKSANLSAVNEFEDLGPGAAGLLTNNNKKILFFVIDPVNEKDIDVDEINAYAIKQSDVLNCIVSLISKNREFMKKVVAIHLILTKSDTLGDFIDEGVIRELLHEQGYDATLKRIKTVCEDYQINRPTGYNVGLFPYHMGRFLAGDVYTFDETDALKILRVIQQNALPIKKKTGPWGTLTDFFNS